MVLRDPPEVKQYAKRGDPPMDQWPGRVVTREDLMKPGGDPRDWFRYGHRLKVYEEAWAEFADARRRGRNFKAGFDWNQILVLGDYGAGKTSVAVHMARHLFGLPPSDGCGDRGCRRRCDGLPSEVLAPGGAGGSRPGRGRRTAATARRRGQGGLRIGPP